MIGLLVVGGIVFSRFGQDQNAKITESQSKIDLRALAQVNQTEAIEDRSPMDIPAVNQSQPTNTNVPVEDRSPIVVQSTATLRRSNPERSTATGAPTPTYPPLYVRINEINLNSSNQYEVVYETFGFTEVLPGQHIHFFFDTVTPENAGMPGSGPWILYGGPRPFTGYSVYQIPRDATQMCALVANANHSVIFESGNCIDLP